MLRTMQTPPWTCPQKLQQAEARNNTVNADNDQDKKTTKGKGRGGKNGKDTKKGKEEDVMKGNSDNNNDDEIEWDGNIGGTCDDDNKAKCDNIEARIINDDNKNNKNEEKQTKVRNKREQIVDNKLGSKHYEDSDNKENCDESKHDKHSNKEKDTLDKVHTETLQEILPKTFKYGLTLVSLSNEALEIWKTIRK